MASQDRSPRLSRRAFLGAAGATGALMGGADAPDPAGGPPRAAMRGHKAELARRVEALAPEIDRWVADSRSVTDAKANNSQLLALQAMMGRFLQRQREVLEQIDPAGAPGAFQDGVRRLSGEIVRAQRVWEYFRTILLTRSSPTLRGPVLAADAVAWDCHRTILLKAASFEAIREDRFREPPLCYPTAAAGPGTWAREETPLGLADQEFRLYKTPIPVILLPWDSLRNSWELVAIHHEVGHVVEADLRLGGELDAAVDAARGVPPERSRLWRGWRAELLADLVGLRLGGPAFAEMLSYALLAPADRVVDYNPEDPHPTPYARVLMNAAYLRAMAGGEPRPDAEGAAEMGRIASEIEARWRGFYGEPPGPAAELLGDFPAVARAMTETKLGALKGNSLAELIPYEPHFDRRIRAAAAALRAGAVPGEPIAPRHAAAAARLAASRAIAAEPDPARALDSIDAKAIELIRRNTPDEVRGGNDARTRFLAGFADTL